MSEFYNDYIVTNTYIFTYTWLYFHSAASVHLHERLKIYNYLNQADGTVLVVTPNIPRYTVSVYVHLLSFLCSHFAYIGII
jgi:hypothetical protein